MATDTIQVGPNATATQIVWAGNGPVLISNSGPATIYVGDVNSIRSSDSQGIVPVTANGYFTVTGLNDMFACVAPGTSANVSTIASGLNFFAPTSLALLGGAAVYVQPLAPTAPIPLNSIWLNTTLGAFETWNGAAWVIQGFTGSELITAGTIAANLLVANIIVAGIVNGTLIQGAELLAGSSPNTQVAITAAGNVGLIQFLMNNAGFANANLDSLVGTFAQLNLGGPSNTNFGHTDSVAQQWNSSDGTGSANGVFVYVDTTNGVHYHAHYDSAGFTIVSGSITARVPGTGSVSIPAGVESFHPISLAANWSTLAGQPVPSYQMLADAGNTLVSIVGALQYNVNIPGGQQVNSVALPSGYWPKTTQYIHGGPGAAGISITPAGIIQAAIEPGQTTVFCNFNGTYPINL